MSKFFRALERAERDHVLQRGRQEKGAAPTEQKPYGGQGNVSANGRLSVELPERLSPLDSRPTQGLTIETLDQIEPHIVSLLAPVSFEAEQFRLLCHALEQVHGDGPLSTLAVSSAAPEDGKTTLSINLVGALAQTPGCRVLLVEGDLRRPAISKMLGLRHSHKPGLVDAVQDSTLSLQEIVRQCSPFNFAVLPAGRSLDSPYEVLKSPYLEGLLQEARQQYDYVVVDTPPLLPFSDCQLVQRWVDSFVVVVTAHKTPRKLVEEAVKTLDAGKVLGLIYNRDDRPVFGYYYSYYNTYSPLSAHRARWPGQSVKKVCSLFRRSTSRGNTGQ